MSLLAMYTSGFVRAAQIFHVPERRPGGFPRQDREFRWLPLLPRLSSYIQITGDTTITLARERGKSATFDRACPWTPTKLIA